MAFTAGSPSFGLADAKVAPWSSAGTYGTLQDVMSVQAMNVTLQYSEAQLTGDDQITATAARAIGGQATFRFGGFNLETMAVILGITATLISSVSQLGVKGGARMPYFGLLGKALVEEGSGDLWLFCPKCKIMGDFNIAQMEYGNFIIPEVTVQLVPDASYGIFNAVTHPTDLAITVMPPANIAILT